MADASGGERRARPERPLLRQEVVEHHQRERIMAAAATAIATKGYRQVSVADIVKEAAIARARFYANYSSKEDCFFALYDKSTGEAFERVSRACQEDQGGFPARVRAGIEALLSYIEANPEVARACVVAGPSVGPAIGERFERVISEFAGLLRAGRVEASEDALAETIEETVAGGFYWLLYYALLEESSTLFEDLLPQLTEFSLIPFVGAEAARSAIT
jgi:AcrR family transcriptional regulator